jgi:hypothetical protein
MRLAKPQPDDHGPVRPFRIQRFPGIGERALPEVALEAFGDIGSGTGHGWRLELWRSSHPLNAMHAQNAPHTKFKTDDQLSSPAKVVIQ